MGWRSRSSASDSRCPRRTTRSPGKAGSGGSARRSSTTPKTTQATAPRDYRPKRPLPLAGRPVPHLGRRVLPCRRCAATHGAGLGTGTDARVWASAQSNACAAVSSGSGPAPMPTTSSPACTPAPPSPPPRAGTTGWSATDEVRRSPPAASHPAEPRSGTPDRPRPKAPPQRRKDPPRSATPCRVKTCPASLSKRPEQP
jgi:hypothetical protein